MGLGLIIVAGAELLTANSCYLSAAVFEASQCRFTAAITSAYLQSEQP